MGMDQPVPLDDIYTEVKINSRIKSREYNSIQQLESEVRSAIPHSDVARIEQEAKQKLERSQRQAQFRSAEAGVNAKYDALLALLSEDESSPDLRGPIENSHSSRMSGFVSDERGSIELRRKNELIKARKRSERDALTDEQARVVEEQLPLMVERLLSQRVQEGLAQKVLDDFGHGVSIDGPKQPLWNIVSSKDRLLLLGRPGAGKSTSLKHIAKRYVCMPRLPLASGGLPDKPRIPLLINLREYEASKESTIFDFVERQFGAYGFAEPKLVLETMLKSSQECSVLFDGLDEVPRSQQSEVVVEITKLAKKYPNNQYIVSCRTANYLGQLERFSELEIADFGQAQISHFVRHWFAGTPSVAVSFLAELARKPGLSELTTTPLLLAMLCVAFNRHQKFPEQKSFVYLACLDALLLDWDSSKQLRRESFVPGFDSESKKLILAKMACDTFCDAELFFTKEEAARKFEELSEVMPGKKVSGRDLLAEFEENHGLLIERARHIYSFSHLTIQEFLAALHLSRSAADVHARLLDELLEDIRWRDTSVFLLCLLSHADELFTALRNRGKACLRSTSVGSLMYSGELPKRVQDFIRSENEGSVPGGWEPWFRWKMFEYNIVKVSHDVSNKSAVNVLMKSEASRYLASVVSVDPYDKTGLRYRRSVNNMLAECAGVQPRRLDTNTVAVYGVNISLYLNLVNVALEALASGSRVSPQLRMRLARDIGDPAMDIWPDPPAKRMNRLGA